MNSNSGLIKIYSSQCRVNYSSSQHSAEWLTEVDQYSIITSFFTMTYYCTSYHTYWGISTWCDPLTTTPLNYLPMLMLLWSIAHSSFQMIIVFIWEGYMEISLVCRLYSSVHYWLTSIWVSEVLLRNDNRWNLIIPGVRKFFQWSSNSDYSFYQVFGVKTITCSG